MDVRHSSVEAAEDASEEVVEEENMDKEDMVRENLLKEIATVAGWRTITQNRAIFS